MSENPGARLITVLSAPSNLGLQPGTHRTEPGVSELPAALLDRGLLSKLRATDAGLVPAPLYSPALDPATHIRNDASLLSYTVKLSERIGELLDQSCFPLVLGGDCSILLGSALALKRRGRFGLLFIDGHTDLLTPTTSQTGGVAGMDLAIVTGEDVAGLGSIDQLDPYVQPEDVVVFGYRWPEKDAASAQPLSSMLALPLSRIREQGVQAAATQAIAHFAGREFWVHLDADVLDPQHMPAVDSPDPGGMRPDELRSILKVALAARNCIGLQVTIYDPTLDDTGHGASLLVELLAESLPL